MNLHRSTPSPRRSIAGAAFLTLACLLASLATELPASASSHTDAVVEHTPGATRGDSSKLREAPRGTKGKTLTRNRLYRTGTMKSVGCAPASQVPLDSSPNLLLYYQSVMPCLDQAWKSRWKKLSKAGVKFRAPKLVVHNGASSSPCGTPGLLSFYCGRNRTIYMYDAEIVNPWNSYPTDYSHGLTRLAGTHTLAHEYGHHVQELVGVLGAIGVRYKGKMARRAELQASCLGNVWLSAQVDAYPILEDYADHSEYWRYITVSNHGSIANQKFWTDRGYISASASTCNSFKAASRLVS